MHRALLAAAGLALAALACAAPAPGPGPPFDPPAGGFARVDVDAEGLALEPAARRALAAAVRQAARDWLDHDRRLDPGGPLALEVRLEELRLRSGAVTWLFAWAAAPDRLVASVRVREGGAEVWARPVRVESALSGYEWRDPATRRERLARRLGLRIARGL